MAQTLLLPRRGGTLVPYTPGAAAAFPAPAGPPRSRVAYAAAHVVCDPLAVEHPTLDAPLDWEATLAFRRHLWSLGLGVAEAMDTAQRGMGLDWAATRELIRRAVAEAKAVGGLIACGAGTDQLSPGSGLSLAAVEAAYAEQCEFIEAQGGRIVLMASRALAACARSPEQYLRVYDRILSQTAQPVILHWLGERFDPQLAGYWGHRDLDAATAVCLELIRTHAARVDGIKVSLLDAGREVALRRQLPPGVKLYTGDDFHYPELIRGDGEQHSHAILGAFDAIAPAAAAALQALDAGDPDRFTATLAPTVPLARHIFAAPTPYYKTGVVFLAYLNGHQAHFRMVGGLESARSVSHLAELFVLADRAGLLRDPDLAVQRMRRLLAVAGVEA